MKSLTPQLFQSMKSYSKEQLVKDIISGIIVAVIALPLSIALAIASGVKPECGLYTAIIAGFFISFFGGSRVQIGGPTAAFVVIIYGIVAEFGMDGLILSTILAGIFLVIMGLCHFGSLIKYIPHTITTGFTCGIGVTLLVGQLKDFLSLDIENVPSEFIDKIIAYAKNITSVNFVSLAVGVFSIAILVVFPKITKKIPGSLVAIIVSTLIVQLAGLDIPTIGSVFGELSSSFPKFHVPSINFEMIKELISPAFTIAILAGIESLLSCVVSDSMINDKHNPNAELIGQGIGNIFSGLFGGIPATGAIARTAANVKNGGRTPIAGIVHSITLLIILLLLMPAAAMIPMTVLAAVLIVVACNMCDWKSFFGIIKTSSKSDALVLVLTFVLTVVFDLVVAIEVGVVLSAILLMSKMAGTTDIKSWRYEGEADVSEEEAQTLLSLPKEIRVFEISGPLFFAAAERLDIIDAKSFTKVVILRMRSVPSIDATAMRSFNKVIDNLQKKGITVILSHVNSVPLELIKKDGLYDKIGAENFSPDITAAIERAKSII